MKKHFVGKVLIATTFSLLTFLVFVKPASVHAQSATKEATPSTLKTILSSANPGDIIELHTGNYSPVVLGRTGYTVTNYPGETATFNGGSSNIQIEITGTYITLKGKILLTNAQWVAVYARAASQHIMIDGIEASYTQSHSIMSDGKDVTIQNTYVHDAVLENHPNTASSRWGSCLKGGYLADGLVIQNNLVERCYGEGIAVTMTVNATIKNNIVRTSWAVGIYVDNAENIVVDKNFITCADPVFWRTTKGSPSIAMSAENYNSYNWTNRLKTITVSNNVVIGCDGISEWDFGNNTPAVNMRIINNSLKDLTSGAGYYIETVYGQSVIVQDNIGSTYYTSSTGITSTNNITQASTTYVGGATTDPASTRLKTDITGIDTGIKDDFGGNTRTLPVSVGAWEFGGIANSPTPTPLPWTTLEGDYTTWFSHYLQSVTGFTNGDFSENGFVDGVDYFNMVK